MNEFEGLVNSLNEYWQLLKDDLSNGTVKYNDIDSLVNDYTFFKVFADLFANTSNLIDLPLSNIKQMYRGVSEKLDLNYYDRMIPKIEYSTKNNRMNPPGEVFIYLGVLGKDKGRPKHITKKFVANTVLKEIRAENDTVATICEFKVNDTAENKKVLNICGDQNIPKQPNELINYIYRKAQKGSTLDKTKLSKIIANIYFNLFSDEKIFKPVNSKEEHIREYEYAPFHALAHFIKEKGYAGLLFRSTVHENGTNLVLFDPNDVQVIKESMEHINTSEYMK